MKSCMLLLVGISGLYAFLLDHSQTTAARNPYNQCISVSEFLSEKKGLQQATDSLRHDTERTFTLLTAQLEKKLNDIESKIHDTKDQEQNVTISKLDVLIRTFAIQESLLTSLLNKTNELQNENIDLKRQIFVLENTTEVQKKEITELQQLRNIQPIKDVKLLEQQINFLSSETHTLSVNERARRQDLLALYNQTDQEFKSLRNKTRFLETENNYLAVMTDDRFQMMDNRLNVTDDKLTFVEKELNATTASFDRQMEMATMKVAMTSCVTNPKTWSYEILKFDDVVTQAGITNIDTFKTSGKFTCTVPGLYHVSVYIFSYTSRAQYAIYNNGKIVSRIYIADHSGNWDHTGTGVVTLLLQAGDTVWIQTLASMEVNNQRYSCLTIVKLK